MKTQIAKDVLAVVRENNSLSSFLQSLQTGKPTTPQSILYDERPVDKSMRNLSGEEIFRLWRDTLERGLIDHTVPVTASGDQVFYQRIWELEESQFKKYGPQGGHPPMAEVWEEIYGNSYTDMPDKLYGLFIEASLETGVHGNTFVDNMRALPALADAVGDKLSSMDLAALLEISGLDVDDPEAFMVAVSDAIKLLKSNRVWNLIPANPTSVVNDLLAEGKLTTNSGYPLFNTRRDPSVIKGSLNAVSSGEYVWYPAIPLFRNYNGKLRGVWMYPFAINIKEATVVRPFMRAVQNSGLVKSGFFTPWSGFDAVKQQISATYVQLKTSYIAATDYSSTDRHFNLSYSVICAYVMAATYKSEYRGEVFANVLRMHTIPLVLSKEEMLVGAHGVASGSELTNLIETIGGLIQGEYERTLSRAKIYGLYGIGDDMCHVVDASIDGREFKDYVADIGSQINQEIKAEKVTASQDYVKSLQRLMQKGYYVPGSNSLVRAVYPTVRALKSIVYPERYHKKANDAEGNPDPYDKFDFCSRVYQILENTCDHPMFNEFVAFVISGNEELIKFVMLDPKDIDHYYERSKRLTGLVDTYNIEYSERKMSQFLSVQTAITIVAQRGLYKLVRSTNARSAFEQKYSRRMGPKRNR